MSEKIYKYEVAFSFLQQDEQLAFEISDLIQDRFSTFIYSEKQKELAGKDGEEAFSKVFAEEARIVVVLFRQDWGKTKWTRIEETAIRGRAHDDGYDFTLFVKLDPEATMPKWLPKTRIYFNFDRWGAKGLAPVIEAKVNETGGQVRPESIEDKAARIKRQYLNSQKRADYLRSSEAYGDAQTEFNRLYQLLETKTKSLEDPTIQLHFGYAKHPGKKFVVRCGDYSAHFYWDYQYSNSLEGSGLRAAIAMIDRSDHQAFIQRQLYGNGAGEKALNNQDYDFDINVTTSEKGWTPKNKKDEFYTSEKLIDKWLDLFLEKVKLVTLGRFEK